MISYSDEPDEDLIKKIQKHKEVAPCLEELVCRHSGIYFDIISKLVPKASPYCSRDDLFDDRNFNIYSAAIKFDPTKGTKFSTFLGNETKWVCLNLYNKAKKKPMLTKSPEELDFIEKEMNDDMIDSVLLKEIFAIVDKHPDRRVGKIFHLRYEEGEGNKALPWKNVAPQVGLSIQGSINVHDMVIKDLKQKLKSN